MTGRRDIHRLPTGARASEGPAPVDSPWISLRAPMRRPPSSARADTERHVRIERLPRQGMVGPTASGHGGPNTQFLTLSRCPRAHLLTPPATTIHDNAHATRFDRFPDCFLSPGNSSTE